ncbi:hypothetical protein [Streptomyces spirodelae]|uniref:Uncharacterized protein n=1 Tax=Streptomyces spirodelae TaxID=2812904 RepID=A0ABS3WU99_9ACTN|nr:hypothetical protein [Streptomyces spirodelae]MBO8186624.1 hypothetical protein [Streptomyces spirodelae]
MSTAHRWVGYRYDHSNALPGRFTRPRYAADSDGDPEPAPCGYCQQLRDMTSLAQHRSETEIASVLSDVLRRHRRDKHPGPHRLTLVRGEPEDD